MFYEIASDKFYILDKKNFEIIFFYGIYIDLDEISNNLI